MGQNSVVNIALKNLPAYLSMNAEKIIAGYKTNMPV